MSWLAPWLLSGLAALTVPVLVHLIRRRDPNRRAFPSLMFLDGSPHEVRGQRTLRDPWLLALRLLALALAVAAFAGPVLDRAADAGDGKPGRDVVLAIDRSLSMAYGDRWREAVHRAKAHVDALEPRDRIALVLFDATAERTLAFSGDRAAVRAAVDGAAVRPLGTDIRAGVAAAGALLAESDAPRRELVLVSDFQRGAFAHEGAPLLPPGTEVRVLGVAAESPSNAFVGSVTLAAQAGERAGSSAPGVVRYEAAARVSAEGEAAPAFATLHVGGQEAERVPLDFAGGVARARFAAIANPRQPLAASVRIPRDALVEDDARYFVLTPDRALAVVLVDGSGEERASLYLHRALSLARRPRVEVTTLAPSELTGARLGNADVVIVNDAPLGEAAHETLAGFVRAGGGLLMVAGASAGGRWPGGADGYLPGRLGGRVEAEAPEGLTVSADGAGEGQGVALDTAGLASASLGRVFRYRRLTQAEGDSVLLRYADGGVALAARPTGAGRAFVLTTTLDNRWNSLPLAPAFLPLVHRAVLALSGRSLALQAFDTGAAVDLVLWLETQAGGSPLHQTLIDGDPLVLHTPAGARRRVDARSPIATLDQPGVYALDRPDGTGPRLLLAANVPAAESMLVGGDPGDVASQLVRMAARDAAARGTRAEARDGTDSGWLWQGLIAAALVLLVAESIVSGNQRIPGRTAGPANAGLRDRSTGEAAP